MAAGGDRRLFSLTGEACDALHYIRETEKREGNPQVDGTQIVNRVLIEEEKRMRNARGEPKD